MYHKTSLKMKGFWKRIMEVNGSDDFPDFKKRRIFRFQSLIFQGVMEVGTGQDI